MRANSQWFCILIGLLILSACSAMNPAQPNMPTMTPALPVAVVATNTPPLLASPTQTPVPATTTPIPATNTPAPATATPPPATETLTASLTQTVARLDNGLTWTECVVPFRDYAMVNSDLELLTQCVKLPDLKNQEDKKIVGERVEQTQAMSDFKITIGKDRFETRMVTNENTGCCTFKYDLIKNGAVILTKKADFVTYDPNMGLWKIGGKLVWELGGWTSDIIVDGVDYNEKYQLQGSYKPYAIHDQLLYIAKAHDKYQLVYADKRFGPEFDDISMPNCCGMIHLFRANGQYWFVGSRAEKKYLVSIQ